MRAAHGSRRDVAAPARLTLSEHHLPLRFAGEVPLPELGARELDEQALELAHRQHVGQRLALPRRPQRQRRAAEERLQRRPPLRHVFAFELLHAGANLGQIQALLDHKHLDSTAPALGRLTVVAR